MVTLTADMKWVKRGAFAAIGQFAVLLTGLVLAACIFLAKTMATHYSGGVAAAEIQEDACQK